MYNIMDGAVGSCPIQKDELLEMAWEERRIRLSDKFQKELALEFADKEADGTKTIVRMQVRLLLFKLSLQNLSSNIVTILGRITGKVWIQQGAS